MSSLKFHRPAGSRAIRSAKGFTLVELLVVIGIIALLISILLPSLSKARKAANTLKCLANIRSILQGMQLYASQNNDYIPGSPVTSGRFVWDSAWNLQYPNQTNCPNISQIWDWEAPIAKVMGIDFEEGGSFAQRCTTRYPFLRDFKGFNCPEAADFIVSPYSGASVIVPAGPMISYNTASQFLLLAPGAGNGSTGVTETGSGLSNPTGYTPKVSQVGPSARKIYIADGARYNATNNPPDLDLGYVGSGGGAYASIGACNLIDKSWSRQGVTAGQQELRAYAYRHGPLIPNSVGDTFRINVGFYDGHAETMGDLAVSDPNLWLPRGASFDTGGTYKPASDTITAFNLSGVVSIY